MISCFQGGLLLWWSSSNSGSWRIKVSFVVDTHTSASNLHRVSSRSRDRGRIEIPFIVNTDTLAELLLDDIVTSASHLFGRSRSSRWSSSGSRLVGGGGCGWRVSALSSSFLLRTSNGSSIRQLQSQCGDRS